MGRRPNALVGEYFTRGAKCSDNSNRYSHTCKGCGEKFPKGRVDSLMSHLLRRCSSTSQVERVAIYRAIQQQNPMPPAPANFDSASPGQTVTDSTTELQAEFPPLVTFQTQQQSALDTLAEVSRQHLDVAPTDRPVQQLEAEQNETDVERQDPEAQFYAQLRDAVKDAPEAAVTGDQAELSEQATAADANTEIRAPKRLIGTATTSEHFEQGALGRDNLDPALHEHNERPHQGTALHGLPIIDHHSDDQLREESYEEHSVVHQGQAAVAHKAPTDNHHEAMSWIPTNGPVETHPSSHNLSNILATAKKPMLFLPNNGVAVAHTFNKDATEVMAASTHPTPGFGPLQRNNTKIRSKFSDNRRKQVQEIRKRGACIRCRMLKKPCSEGTPCNTCKTVGSARLWKGSCLRTRLADEFTLWSCGLFNSKAKILLADITPGLEKASEDALLEVRLLPQSDKYITLAAKNHKQNGLGKQRAAMNAYSGSDPDLVLRAHFDAHKDTTPIYLLVEEVGVLSKIEDYINEIFDICIEDEKSSLLKSTLQRAQSLIKAEDEEAATNQPAPLRPLGPTQPSESGFPDQPAASTRTSYTFQTRMLLHSVLELWVSTTLLTRQSLSSSAANFQITLLSQDSQSQPRTLPPHNLAILKAQLLSALETRCSQLSKSIITELERRLLQRQQVSRFATFVAALILLNCVERMAGYFHTFSNSEDGEDWPLEIPAADLWPQGEQFANLLIMLLRMRGLPPRTMSNNQGRLVVVKPGMIRTASLTKQLEHEALESAAEWLDPLELDWNEVITLRDSGYSGTGETRDLKFVSRAILPADV